MNETESPYKFALMIPQSDTERLLEEHLASLGVYVNRQLKLKQFQPEAVSVSCTLVHSDYAEETVEASWLIGCDGAHSTVRHQLGFEFHPKRPCFLEEVRNERVAANFRVVFAGWAQV
jgi:2-polyprenyl-6-methoxyphenol hydroxylase-like FAD-dependent oxidoreductase